MKSDENCITQVTAFLADVAGIDWLEGECEEKLKDFHTLLASENRVTNLTRLTADHDYWIKHVADSLSIGGALPWLQQPEVRVVDIGSGGGFPVIPLAIAYPSLILYAVESSQKKADFLTRAINRLELPNITVLARQAREMAKSDELSAQFDLVTARAVATAGRLLRDCRQFIRESGVLCFYKTPASIEKEAAESVREAKKFGFVSNRSETLILPGGYGERQFFTFRHQ